MYDNTLVREPLVSDQQRQTQRTDFYLHMLVYFKTIMIEVLVKNYKTATTELRRKKKVKVIIIASWWPESATPGWFKNK